MSTCLVVVEGHLEVVLLVDRLVAVSDRQHLVNSFKAGEDYLHLVNQLANNYSTAANVIRVWLQDGRVETRRQGGAHNVVVTGAMDEEAIGEITSAAPFTTLTSMKLAAVAAIS